MLILMVFGFSRSALAEFGSIVDIGLAGDFYFTDESANNGQGFVNLLIQNTWSESQLWVDVGGGGLVGDTANSYVKAPQFYYRSGRIGSPHFTVGRALHDWSHLDTFWNMGVTQPNFRWDEARPEIQGLTGLFFTLPFNSSIEATFFLSPFFIPSQGPSFELIDGNLTSSNPWFNEPVEIINLSGEKADLNFNVDIPKTQDVIVQESYGAQIGTHVNKKDWTFNIFFLDKPRNDLVLPFDGVLNLSTFNGDITARPRVARHRVGGVDLGWNFEDFKTVVSWLYESKVDYTAPEGTTYPVLPEQNIFSLTQLIRLSRTHRIWLGYVKVNRNQTEVAGAFSGSSIDTYLYRNRFEEAFRIKWSGLLLKIDNQYRVNASLSFNQSLYRDNVWVSSDIRWSIYRGIEAFSQCDFFGGSDPDIQSVDFMSTYQNNDRCMVGGHYAF